jgi:hypothetical protein
MNDFFNRFPNLPIANMKSLKHIQNHGRVLAQDFLLADEPRPFKRKTKRNDRLLLKSKVLSAPKSGVQAQVKHPYIYTIHIGIQIYTPKPRSVRKRIFISKPTYKPLHLPSAKPLHFKSFAIVTTTPRSLHFPSSKSLNQFLSTTSHSHSHHYSSQKTKTAKTDSKFKELKIRFNFFAEGRFQFKKKTFLWNFP